MWAEVFNELSRLLSYLRSGLFTGVGNSVSIVWTIWGWNDWSAGAIAFEKHFILIAKTMKIYSDHDISETMDMEVYTIKNELSTWRPEPDSDVILWSFYDTIVLEMIENILHCIVQWSFFFFFFYRGFQAPMQMILLIIVHYLFPFSSLPMRFWSLLWERFRPTEAEDTLVDDFMTCSWESPYWRLIFNKTVKGFCMPKLVVLVQNKQHQNGNESLRIYEFSDVMFSRVWLPVISA